jgi:hypothetical protein
MLHYHAIISILEVHDLSSPPSSDSDDVGSSGSSGDEEYQGYDLGWGFLNSWLATRHLVSEVDPSRQPWSPLPVTDRGVSWTVASGDAHVVVASHPTLSHRQVGPVEHLSCHVSYNGSQTAFGELVSRSPTGARGGRYDHRMAD